MAKSKQIAELKEDSIRHNRELDDITAAVQAAQTASADVSFTFYGSSFT